MNLFRKKENCPTASIPVPGRVKRGFRRYALTVLTVFTACAMAIPVSATGGDPLTVVNNLSEFIFSLIRAIGLLLQSMLKVRTEELQQETEEKLKGFREVEQKLRELREKLEE